MPLFIDNIIVLMTVHFGNSHEISNQEMKEKSNIFRMKLVPGSQQQFMQVSPEYVLKPDFKWLISHESYTVNKWVWFVWHLSHILNSVKLKKLEKFIDPLTKECVFALSVLGSLGHILWNVNRATLHLKITFKAYWNETARWAFGFS